MAKRDYYDILGISRNASKKEIKKAYKRLALKYHPDVSKEKGAEERFKEVSEAYAVLSDDEKRQQYDTFGHQAFDQRYSRDDIFHGFDFDEIFREFGFGGSIFDMFFGGTRRKRKGRDIEHETGISFEEAAFGIEKEVKVQRTILCSECNGTGARNSELEKCPECNGSGQIRKTQRTVFGLFTQSGICSNCNGEGQIPRYACNACYGTGLVRETKNLKVKIPAGVNNGSTLRITGEGEAVKGGDPGDLYLIVYVSPHKLFRREGNNIILELPLTFPQATLGTEVRVPTLDGHIKLKIPPGTQHGTRFRLKGKGIKRLNTHGYGDQFIIARIKTPTRLNKKQRELYKELAKYEAKDIFSRLNPFS